MTKSLPTEEQIQKGLEVSGKIQIHDVRLVECKCVQTEAAQHGKKNVNVDVETSVQTPSGDRTILVFVTFCLKGTKDGEADSPVMQIDGKFLLLYAVDNASRISQDALAGFAHTNGVFHAWPYWREFVQSVTGRMGLPPLVMPVFRIGPSQKPGTGPEGDQPLTAKPLSEQK